MIRVGVYDCALFSTADLFSMFERELLSGLALWNGIDGAIIFTRNASSDKGARIEGVAGMSCCLYAESSTESPSTCIIGGHGRGCARSHVVGMLRHSCKLGSGVGSDPSLAFLRFFHRKTSRHLSNTCFALTCLSGVSAWGPINLG